MDDNPTHLPRALHGWTIWIKQVDGEIVRFLVGRETEAECIEALREHAQLTSSEELIDGEMLNAKEIIDLQLAEGEVRRLSE